MDFVVTVKRSLGSLSESYSKVVSAKNKKRAAYMAIAEFKAIQPFSIKGEVIEVESVIPTDLFDGFGDFEIEAEVQKEKRWCDSCLKILLVIWLEMRPAVQA
jgi:hypothetical protein